LVISYLKSYISQGDLVDILYFDINVLHIYIKRNRMIMLVFSDNSM